MNVFFTFLMGWVALRLIQKNLIAPLSRKRGDEKLNEQNQTPNTGKTLELIACSSCGIYTTMPCTNPDCSGRR